MLSCTSPNTLTRGKYQRVAQNLDIPKNGLTLEFGAGLSIASLTLLGPPQPPGAWGLISCSKSKGGGGRGSAAHKWVDHWISYPM